MHAFLIVGNIRNELKTKSEELAKKLHAKVLEFPLAKIEDVRNLNSLIRLSFDEPTLVVSENIHEATEEALNALLKNLEEPQENIYFALTSPSVRKVLPTIVSRCEIIKSTNNPSAASNDVTQSTNVEDAEKFLGMTVGEKLAYIDKIKDRHEALELVENTVDFLHGKLHSDTIKYTEIAANVETATETLTRLSANGNVNLQLTNLVINLK